jgi:hypothetical protein
MQIPFLIMSFNEECMSRECTSKLEGRWSYYIVYKYLRRRPHLGNITHTSACPDIA